MNFDWACNVICMLFQNSIHQAVSYNKCFIIYQATAKNSVVRCNTPKVVKLKVHVLQLLNIYKSHDIMSLLRDMKLV